MKRIIHIPISKPKSFLTLLVVFFSPFILVAQIVKTFVLKETLAVNDSNNTFAIEAINTNFIFYPSKTTSLVVHAYREGVSENESQKWDLKLQKDATSIKLLSVIRPKQTVTSEVRITGDVSSKQLAKMLKYSLAPLLKNLQNNPIPEVLKTELNQLNFDFEAYNKIGEPYLKIWEQAFVDRLDENDSKQVKAWSRETVSNLIRVSKQGAPQIAKPVSQSNTNEQSGYQVFFSKSIKTAPLNPNNEYTIEVGVPHNMHIQLNARHGSFISKSVLNNIKGNLKYTPFKAEQVGGDTDLSVDFASVSIDSWQKGKLSISYSKQAEIRLVNQLQLKLNSSKMKISQLSGKGIFNGSFSKLQIDETIDSFKNLVFLLTQSDLILTLPNTSYNFAYTGNLSLIEYPKEKLQVSSLGDFQSHMLHGFALNRNTPKELQINAKYSQVFLK